MSESVAVGRPEGRHPTSRLHPAPRRSLALRPVRLQPSETHGVTSVAVQSPEDFRHLHGGQEHRRVFSAARRGYSARVTARRALVRRTAALFAIAIVTVMVPCWLFIRVDLRAVRAAVHSSAVPDVPMNVLNAFTAAEDPCHWKHRRTYTLTTVGAVFFADADELWPQQAGHASLAGQLVRYHVNGRGVSRQIREVLVTAIIEATENPTTVARAYTNSVYLGATDGNRIYGVTDAARIYYRKRASELNLAERVTLAASIRSPHIYSPGVQSERAVLRRLSVLSRLRELRLVSPHDFASAERKLRGAAG
jgi:hypothetical protein